MGERGPKPKCVPTFPELTCHSVEDLHVLNTRELQRYTISQEDIDTYEREVIPYWKGRTQRERIFSHVPQEWKEAYEVGMFTEFMEQRAPGHTALDGKVYKYGLLDLKECIRKELDGLDFMNDPEATDKQEELTAMSISCDAAILFAERHADLADEMSLTEKDPKRAAELRRIAEVCRQVPAHAPRDYWEAIQMYWFVHLGTITELNGWDAMNPGHFDQHLAPFYEKGTRDGTLTRDEAKELMSCFFIKVNNHTAPPKVGITAKESGTYNDFTNHEYRRCKSRWQRRVSEVSYIMLETIERTAYPATRQCYPYQCPYAGTFPACRLQGDPPGAWLSVCFQSGCVYPGVDAPGKIVAGCTRRRVQRLYRGRGVRQGGVCADRLPECAEDLGGDAPQRCRSGFRA